MGLHKLSAGDGYTYLIRQVAAGDSTERGYSSLGDYYSAQGETPGMWWGAGLIGLGTSGEVTEQQMRNLFGQGVHPDAEQIIQARTMQGGSAPAALAATRLGAPYRVVEGTSGWRERLGERYQAWNQVRDRPEHAPVPADERARIRTEVAGEMFAEEHGRAPLNPAELSGFVAQVSRPESNAVAGFDLTFSPVKTVSTLWAVARREQARLIEDAHAAAVTATLEFLQRDAAYTRVGANGVRQVDVTGLVAAVFTHRDSRAGDPDLHTHVAVSNKVQTLDGRWLALDGRMLYRFKVTASEFYNARLEAEVTARFGGAFLPRAMGPGKRPVRELAGVDEQLAAQWSSRRRVIEHATSQLAERFVAEHGRVPTAVETLRLAQRATLDTREAKHEPRSLAEQRAEWRRQALGTVGGKRNLDGMLARVRAAAAAEPFTPGLVDELAAATIATVADARARWYKPNLLAEALRQVRAAGVDPQRVTDYAATVTRRAIAADHSVPIGADLDVTTAVPVALRRADGTSMYRVAHGQQYTSPAVLDAERRILAAAGRADGMRISAAAVEIAMLEWSANHDGRVLNHGQRAMVQEVATSGRRVQLAMAPAGTGKTTVMGVLAAAWQHDGGHIVGLAPQASAAEELRSALHEVDTDTLDKLVFELTEHQEADRPDWITAIGPNTLVILDEAGLASTPKLDTAIRHVLAHDGRVLLVGDDRQRAAAGAGGVLRDIDAAHGSATLTEVMRFTDPAEGAASLALRAGDASAVGFYADRGRLHAVTADTAIDTVYAAWAHDRAAGRDSIMMAPTLDQVAALNARARAARLAADHQRGLPVGPEHLLPNGETVSAGDVIVSKKNKRSLTLGGTDFVQNNHRWEVLQVRADGSLRVEMLGRDDDRAVRTSLPAWYVDDGHVRLGYAHTLAGCQGLTVGVPGVREGTAHALLNPDLTRNDAYPALTRAVTANHGYAPLGGGTDPHQVVTPDAVNPPTVHEALARMIERDGSARSATTEIRDAVDPHRLLGQSSDAYTDAIVAGAETLLGPERLEQLAAGAERAVAGITAAPAWDTLRGHLTVLAADGHDPIRRLTVAAGRRELDTARDTAAVLDYRLDPTGNHSQTPGPLPWVPAVPRCLADRPEWQPYLAARAARVTAQAGEVALDSQAWTLTSAPAWATPYLDDRALIADLAVWRAAHSVPDTDVRPAGPRPRRIALIRRHTDLADRCAAVAGHAGDGQQRWAAILAHRGVDLTHDDFWPVLVARLTLADTAKLPVPALLEAALGRGPMPSESPASALWWRLAPHLGALTSPGNPQQHRIRPAWTDRMAVHLGPKRSEQVTADRLWPVLVARVDAAAATGVDPHQLVDDAAGMLAAAGPMHTHELATVLLWHVGALADPDPVTPGDGSNGDIPPDPADADLVPPPDLYLSSIGMAAAAPEPADQDTKEPSREQPDRVDQPTGRSSESVNTRTGPDPRAERTAIDGWTAVEPDDAPDEPDPDTAAEPDLPVDARVTAVGRALDAVAAAWEHYQRQAPRSWVPEYLAGRGLDPTVAGYAPGGWTNLVDHLQRSGYTGRELLAAGLARTSRTHPDRVIDAFVNRAVLPIHDTHGRVVAFIGRKHPADTNPAVPKYVNSPSTELYRKADLPYGLNPAALDALRGGADLVIVEGPLDAHAVTAAAAHRAPGTQALVPIAPLGTALTGGQLRALNDIAPLHNRRVVVALDNDTAGMTASLAAHELLDDAGITGHTITLPAGQDPAQVLADSGAAELAAALDARRPLADLIVDHALDTWPLDHNFETVSRDALNAVAPIIGNLPARQRYRQAARAARRLNLDAFSIVDTVTRHVPEALYAAEASNAYTQPPDARRLLERTEALAAVTEQLRGAADTLRVRAPDDHHGPDIEALSKLDREPT